MIYDKIKITAKEKGYGIEELCKKIGITHSGFYRMIKNHTMSIKTLEKISELLDVDVSQWFQDPHNAAKDKDCKCSDKYLEELEKAEKEIAKKEKQLEQLFHELEMKNKIIHKFL